MIPKMYQIRGYKVIICINAPKIFQNLFKDSFDLPKHSEGDQKLCKLFLNNFCGPKDSKNVSYAGLQWQFSLINMVGPSQPLWRVGTKNRKTSSDSLGQSRGDIWWVLVFVQLIFSLMTSSVGSGLSTSYWRIYNKSPNLKYNPSGSLSMSKKLELTEQKYLEDFLWCDITQIRRHPFQFKSKYFTISSRLGCVGWLYWRLQR